MTLWFGLSLGANIAFIFVFVSAFWRKSDNKYNDKLLSINKILCELHSERNEYERRQADSIEMIADIYTEKNKQ